ncbi:MAG: diguanylate cyclase, partial [Oscillospiraceae bacterium]
TDKAGIKKVIKIIFQKFNEDKKYIDTMGLCSLSVGVAIAKKPKAHFDTLYRQADIALYHVKDSGKKSYCYYEDLLEARENYVRSKTKEDVNNLKRYLKGRFSGDDSFEKRYEYELVYYTLANNMIDGANVRFIVFTLVDMRNLNGKEAIRKSMRDLNFAVEKSMREYDFSIKYSENQYILMLQNVSEAALTSVGVRISLAYREACEEKDIEIIYSVS